ncbi:MAG: high-affinity branched-chain amino acid ABC transporter permease LivM [Alphaproteobacteria bacterium]|nr:high-affinity branched-chain amino acid ABC transporter permease LivM [Alphaproteobacteria bacterium]
MASTPKSTELTAGNRPLDAAHVIKDLVITALLSLAILGPIVGLKTVTATGTLALVHRWGLVAVLIAIVVVGRLLHHLYVWNKAQVPARPPSKAPAKSTGRELAIAKYLTPILLLIAVALPFLAGMTGSRERQIMDLAILILTYIMLGWGLNIVVGLAGLLDLGYVAFYAVGAYTYALLATVYFPQWFGDGIIPWAFFITLPVAGFLAALWGVILGFPVLRLRGDYLAIVTLAFGEIIRVILLNWVDFTGGPNGISGIPRPSFFGLPFVSGEGGFAAAFGIEHKPIHRIVFLYYIILILALVTNLVTIRLRKLPVGRAWEALREDEIACRSLGINTTNTKLTAFAIGAMFGGFAGSFFATRQGFISPESFVFMESAIILAIVVLGGLGSQIGVVFASIAIIGAFEAFRQLDVLKQVMPEGFDPGQFRMLAVGLAMVLIMRWKPRGFVTRRDPSVYLKEKKSVSGDFVAEGHG